MNNVLAAIMALGSMMKERHQGDPAIGKSMDLLLHAAGRGRDLVKGLTDFARKDIPEPRPMDLNEVVRKEAELLNRATFQKVAVELALQENIPEVRGDASSISNALMNLCVNALDAMPSGGRLYLTTGIGSDGEVTLAVRDSGLGMSPEVLQRAMEPFFTTKPVGKGTGLGLALVYGVMKAHGGKVEIRSELGKGTEITLHFPRLGSDRGGMEAPNSSEAVQTRQFQILLVDDDDLIRDTVPTMLETIGHRVVALRGGLEAIQRLQTGFDPDVVILDLSMPGMDGEQTLEQLRVLKPNVPVILATGYEDDRAARILERFPNVDVLAKPFTLMDLKVKLAQIN
jgi:CheY-like chemotaxis protein